MRARRWFGAALVVVVLPFAGAACGNDDDNRSVRSNGGGSGSSTSDTSPSSYVGLTKKAAIAKAEADDVVWRILREDDEQFLVTMDYNPERINFEIDDGKVTKATNG